jgi:hypothetical protein
MPSQHVPRRQARDDPDKPARAEIGHQQRCRRDGKGRKAARGPEQQRRHRQLEAELPEEAVGAGGQISRLSQNEPKDDQREKRGDQAQDG